MKADKATLNALFSKFVQILVSKEPIKLHIEEIAEIRRDLFPYLKDYEKVHYTNEIRGKVQREAKEAWRNTPGLKGAIIMATGTGKSKIAVELSSGKKTLVVVPTEKLRDDGWKKEFKKWDSFAFQNEEAHSECYMSLASIEGQEYDLVVLDEGHNITEANSVFFKKNKVGAILWISASRPKDPTKLNILRSLGIIPCYEIGVDEAVKLGIVAPFEITVVEVGLNSVDKNVKAGSKKKPFNVTEKSQYAYLSSLVSVSPSKSTFLARSQFIYNLKSKTEAAKWILDNVIPTDFKTLIFCGSKRQAVLLNPYRYFSKPALKSGEKDPIKIQDYNYILSNWDNGQSYSLFQEGKINRLSCVSALNEGENIDGLDVGLMVQINSSDIDFTQRVGRIIRYRAGHTGKIIIIVAKDTVDEEWCQNILSKLSAPVRRIEFSRLSAGIETISF